MMISNGIKAVLRRELREKLLSKSFITMTLLIPLFIIGIMALQTYIMTFEDDKLSTLVMGSESQVFLDSLKKELSDPEYMKENKVVFIYEKINEGGIDSSLAKYKKDLADEKLSGYFYFHADVLTSKNIDYYSVNPNNRTVYSKVTPQINKVLLELYFDGKNLSDDDLKFAKKSLDIKGLRVGLDESIKEVGIGNTIVSFLFSFLLYMSLLINGTIMMRSVLEEKNNRIVEVLLSSIRPIDMMVGKILGTSITGVLQMALWLSPVVLLLTTDIFALPSNFELDLDPLLLIYFLFNYFVALVTYLGLFAAAGAMFDNDQDAQNGMWPVMMLVMIPFFIAIGLQGNPGNALAKVSSMLPFSLFMVMPARISVIDVPTWQFIVSNVVGVLTMFAIFPIAGKIYRIGILMTGKKPTWGEIIKWVRYKN